MHFKEEKKINLVLKFLPGKEIAISITVMRQNDEGNRVSFSKTSGIHY